MRKANNNQSSVTNKKQSVTFTRYEEILLDKYVDALSIIKDESTLNKERLINLEYLHYWFTKTIVRLPHKNALAEAAIEKEKEKGFDLAQSVKIVLHNAVGAAEKANFHLNGKQKKDTHITEQMLSDKNAWEETIFNQARIVAENFPFLKLIMTQILKPKEDTRKELLEIDKETATKMAIQISNLQNLVNHEKVRPLLEKPPVSTTFKLNPRIFTSKSKIASNKTKDIEIKVEDVDPHKMLQVLKEISSTQIYSYETIKEVKKNLAYFLVDEEKVKKLLQGKKAERFKTPFDFLNETTKEKLIFEQFGLLEAWYYLSRDMNNTTTKIIHPFLPKKYTNKGRDDLLNSTKAASYRTPDSFTSKVTKQFEAIASVHDKLKSNNKDQKEKAVFKFATEFVKLTDALLYMNKKKDSKGKPIANQITNAAVRQNFEICKAYLNQTFVHEQFIRAINKLPLVQQEYCKKRINYIDPKKTTEKMIVFLDTEQAHKKAKHLLLNTKYLNLKEYTSLNTITKKKELKFEEDENNNENNKNVLDVPSHKDVINKQKEQKSKQKQQPSKLQRPFRLIKKTSKLVNKKIPTRKSKAGINEYKNEMNYYTNLTNLTQKYLQEEKKDPEIKKFIEDQFTITLKQIVGAASQKEWVTCEDNEIKQSNKVKSSKVKQGIYIKRAQYNLMEFLNLFEELAEEQGKKYAFTNINAYQKIAIYIAIRLKFLSTVSKLDLFKNLMEKNIQIKEKGTNEEEGKETNYKGALTKVQLCLSIDPIKKIIQNYSKSETKKNKTPFWWGKQRRDSWLSNENQSNVVYKTYQTLIDDIFIPQENVTRRVQVSNIRYGISEIIACKNLLTLIVNIIKDMIQIEKTKKPLKNNIENSQKLINDLLSVTLSKEVSKQTKKILKNLKETLKKTGVSKETLIKLKPILITSKNSIIKRLLTIEKSFTKKQFIVKVLLDKKPLLESLSTSTYQKTDVVNTSLADIFDLQVLIAEIYYLLEPYSSGNSKLEKMVEKIINHIGYFKFWIIPAFLEEAQKQSKNLLKSAVEKYDLVKWGLTKKAFESLLEYKPEGVNSDEFLRDRVNEDLLFSLAQDNQAQNNQVQNNQAQDNQTQNNQVQDNQAQSNQTDQNQQAKNDQTQNNQNDPAPIKLAIKKPAVKKRPAALTKTPVQKLATKRTQTPKLKTPGASPLKAIQNKLQQNQQAKNDQTQNNQNHPAPIKLAIKKPAVKKRPTAIIPPRKNPKQQPTKTTKRTQTSIPKAPRENNSDNIQKIINQTHIDTIEQHIGMYKGAEDPSYIYNKVKKIFHNDISQAYKQQNANNPKVKKIIDFIKTEGKVIEAKNKLEAVSGHILLISQQDNPKIKAQYIKDMKESFNKVRSACEEYKLTNSQVYKEVVQFIKAQETLEEIIKLIDKHGKQTNPAFKKAQYNSIKALFDEVSDVCRKQYSNDESYKKVVKFLETTKENTKNKIEPKKKEVKITSNITTDTQTNNNNNNNNNDDNKDSQENKNVIEAVQQLIINPEENPEEQSQTPSFLIKKEADELTDQMKQLIDQQTEPSSTNNPPQQGQQTKEQGEKGQTKLSTSPHALMSPQNKNANLDHQNNNNNNNNNDEVVPKSDTENKDDNHENKISSPNNK